MAGGGDGGALASLPRAKDDSAAIRKLVSPPEEPRILDTFNKKVRGRVHVFCLTHPESSSVPVYNSGFETEGSGIIQRLYPQRQHSPIQMTSEIAIGVEVTQRTP